MDVRLAKAILFYAALFKSIHGLAPDYLCDVINMQRDICQRPMRSQNVNNVYVPYGSLKCFKNTFVNRGSSLWNALPHRAKECHTLNTFKKFLKLHNYTRYTVTQ